MGVCMCVYVCVCACVRLYDLFMRLCVYSCPGPCILMDPDQPWRRCNGKTDIMAI